MRNVFVFLNTVLNSETCLQKKKRKTELKLEMEQNVWQSSQKLIYPLKSETVIKLKLKKSLNFCFFFNVSTTENWQ